MTFFYKLFGYGFGGLSLFGAYRFTLVCPKAKKIYLFSTWKVPIFKFDKTVEVEEKSGRTNVTYYYAWFTFTINKED